MSLSMGGTVQNKGQGSKLLDPSVATSVFRHMLA